MRKNARGSAPPELASIDELFAVAGLTRTGRTRGPHIRHKSPPEASIAELQRRAAPPRLAANGANWLPVPGWDLPWLWSGFSTRKGGLSRAYCSEGEPGELNLGFTAQDDRAAV